MQNLDRVLSAIAGDPVLALAPARCLRISGGARCDRCVRACSLRLPFSDSDDILSPEDLERCTGCGACAAACPTGAIDIDGRLLAEWVRSIDAASGGPTADARLTISCSSVATPSHLRVTCARAVDDSLALRATLASSEGVALVVGDCATCTMGDNETAGRLKALAERANALSSALELPSIVVSQQATDGTHALPAQAPIDRRDLLASIGLGGRALIASVLSGTEPRRVPDATARPAASESPFRHATAVDTMARAASRLPEASRSKTRLPEQTPGPLSHSIPCVQRDSCTACGECVPFCPTGALRKRVVAGEWRLSVSWSRCVGCGLCVELCRHAAITLEQRHIPGIVRAGRVLLIRRPTATCSMCGAVFPESRPRATEETASPSDTSPVCTLCERHTGRITGVY